MNLIAQLRRVFTRNRYQEYCLKILIYPRGKACQVIPFYYWCHSKQQLIDRAIEVFELENYRAGRLEKRDGVYYMTFFETNFKLESA